MYRAYNTRPIPKPLPDQHDKRLPLAWFLLPVLLAALYVIYAFTRPLPEPTVRLMPPVVPAQVSLGIPWPATAQAAYGAEGFGLLASHNEQKPSPTASVAKAITALAVLEKKPLVPGEQGPAITLTAKDAALYQNYAAQDGSVVPVSDGETITEYQALQAMMLPSANNIADTMAIWTFGSMDAYHTYATGLTQRLGMTQTTIGTDASGFSPTTTSTASDLVRLGDAVLHNPVLAEIVGQKQAVFPDYGTMNNVNVYLGQYGIRGIKTGNTDQAGGCFLVAADVPIGGKTVTVIAAVMGAGNLSQAMRASIPMVQSSVSLFHTSHVTTAGQVVGQITTDWGAQADITADKAIDVLAWNGSALSPRVQKKPISLPAAAHTSAGNLSLTYQDTTYTSPLHTAGAVAGPTAWWRVEHPF